jgi:tRNA-splicing ligase RtcB
MNPYDTQLVEHGVPIKMWTRGVPVEDDAKQQLANAARLPIVFRTSLRCPTCTWASAPPSAR